VAKHRQIIGSFGTILGQNLDKNRAKHFSTSSAENGIDVAVKWQWF
jgi:hypothetical protein